MLTRWDVTASEGFDAIAFTGALSGGDLYLEHYAKEAAEFGSHLPSAVRDDLVALRKDADTGDFGLLWPNLATILSGAEVPTLDSVVAARKRANVLSMIDVNRGTLSARFVAFPNLVSAQFVPLYFGTWEETRQSAELFLRNNGNDRNAGDLHSQQIIQLFSGYFPTSADREWLRLFVQAVEDERVKFFASYWRAEQLRRSAARAVVDSLWRTTYRQRFARFLNNSGADRGSLLLSLPLDGEGRTLDVGQRTRLVTVNFPDTPANAREALYTFVHEIVSSVTTIAIDDNTSPADKRNGTVDRYASNALVRGGALMLQRAAPELADGYARYYLRSARVPFTSGDAMAALAAAFPLPDAIRDGIQRQIELVMGGI